MENIILEATNITKIYKHNVALENINIKLFKNKIYGFIGENGAGKSTFFRVIMGLVFPTKGTISLFGSQSIKETNKLRKKIGSVLDEPILYNNMTAHENMKMMQLINGYNDKKDINNKLELVSLSNTKSKKVKEFSLGMKQRLAIAMALVGNPDFLILDEPVNGLDPKSIVEIRELIKNLWQYHDTTVLLSSHLLSELYQLATDYIIIHKGQILESFELKDFENKKAKCLTLKINNPQEALSLLQNRYQGSEIEITSDANINFYNCPNDTEEIIKYLFNNDFHIYNITNQDQSLEDYYLNLIGGV